MGRKREDSEEASEEVSDVEEDSEEEVPKKKAASKGKRKAADSNKPKKSLSAYMIFSNEKRKGEKEANPSLSFGEMTKHLSSMWNGLTAEEKKPYEAKAAADKERYNAEKANYTPDDDDDEGGKGKKKKAKKEKDPNKPKKNLNAYMFFAKAMRPRIVDEHPEVKGQAKEVTRLIGEKWNGLNESQKKPFEEEAARDKIRYQKAMEQYNKGK